MMIAEGLIVRNTHLRTSLRLIELYFVSGFEYFERKKETYIGKSTTSVDMSGATVEKKSESAGCSIAL